MIAEEIGEIDVTEAEAKLERANTAIAPRSESLEAMHSAQVLARDRWRTAIAGVQMLFDEFGRLG
jgi:hypothetical protein